MYIDTKSKGLEQFLSSFCGILKCRRTDYFARRRVCHTQDEMTAAFIRYGYAIFEQFSAIKLIFRFFEFKRLRFTSGCSPQINLLGRNCHSGKSLRQLGESWEL